MSSLQRTPLYPLYSDFPSARCIDFGGWELPVQFSGIVQEHEAVRKQAGLFDVSHMGEFIVTGADAETFIQKMTTNDVTRLSAGQAQYTLMCYDNGGTVDDLLVYKLSADQFMLVVNASNIDKDLQWLQDHLTGDVIIQNVSAETALIAIQGPDAVNIMAQATSEALSELPSFHFIQNAQVCGATALLSRTGYTGEDGFEIYCSAADAPVIWSGLLAAGQSYGLIPTGLGARDTLRFEAKLPLYGQELSSTISPLEASLGFFVKLDSGDFIGREALQQQKNAGVPRKLVGIELIDRGIPRSHYPVFNSEGEPIGEVTSGTQSPTLKRNLGLALIETAYTSLDSEVWVEIRGKKLKAKVVKTPFYKRGAALS
ncbi:glycine cleavage system aminomethyltransferase GcvT [Paenibacillus glucanolyticus]|uniref:glycine cleavage system aminomethyltransferase GcvT n=1 Tax=Paenibacillus TaxID=44249 RepID=UPI0003E23568|nr:MULTISPECIES: glycine cleavage system aminomethyltransferase GcvT [Paenibacillus]ANA82610.1 glycine cleavage system protein T [Paenibacillus glucanolyticus]AVV58648.1 glycine cleavage system aminomethyltransferase GcvT [Paenibacillus glucanolyticus]ETT39774.1 glycine cleavage system T protein [Paenibacillus sp. FSL R5-808]MPY17393.1 glycine cleavage system aminomethyltransferase GcvT [Paenibacillus glucanolyticus]